jgi:cation diffusion facilitator CzcD-associated flavoprotein CzcO
MLQRSPTYIVPLPNRSVSSLLDYVLPRAMALRLKRLRWILTSRLFYLFCTSFPSSARSMFRRATLRLLPKNMSFDPHFNPTYNPWAQRLCICPDGDFYKALHTGRANVVTDTIRTVTPAGIQLDSGAFLDADVIVTATGLKVRLAGGATLDVDGNPVAPADKFMWRGAMLQDVPNAAFVMGYTNASWTLGADATASMVVRLLQTLEQRGSTSAVPRVDNAAALQAAPILNLSSTYLKAATGAMPKAASTGVFAARGNYLADDFHARYGSLDGLEWIY